MQDILSPGDVIGVVEVHLNNRHAAVMDGVGRPVHDAGVWAGDGRWPRAANLPLRS